MYYLPKPNKECQMAVKGDFVAIVYNRTFLYLVNNKTNKLARFQFSEIIKILFLPKDDHIYIFTKEGKVLSKLLVTNSSDEGSESRTNEVGSNDDFDNFIKLPHGLKDNSFIYLVRYTSITYVIIDEFIYMFNNNVFGQSYLLDCKICSAKLVPTDFIKAMNFYDGSFAHEFVLTVSTSLCSVGILTFPDRLISNESISKVFATKSEFVDLMLFTPDVFVFVGCRGTVLCWSKDNILEIGYVPYPVSNAFVTKPEMFFVIDNKLYSAPMLSPGNFKIVKGSPCNIICSSGNYGITDHGCLFQLTNKSDITVHPSPEYVEFMIKKIDTINREIAHSTNEVKKYESFLLKDQIAKSISDGVSVFDTSLALHSYLLPDGEVCVEARISINPNSIFTCRGLSFSLILSNTTQSFSNQYCISDVKTDFVEWKQPLVITDPQKIRVDLCLYDDSLQQTCSVILATKYYDILDLSVEVEPSMIYSLDKSLNYNIHSLSYKILGWIDETYHRSVVKKTPYGHYLTLNIDEDIVLITSTDMSTLFALKSSLDQKFIISNEDKRLDASRLTSIENILNNITETSPVSAHLGTQKNQIEKLLRSIHHYIEDV